MSSPWYSTALSPEQQTALSRCANTGAILASAGSGKTKTLVYAIANDLLNGVKPEEIVAFTFTKKAASELLARVHFLLREVASDKDVTGLKIGTIHSWCLDFLLENSSYYNFEPIEEDIQLYALVGRLYDTLDLEHVHGKKYPLGIRDFLADVEIFYNESLSLTAVPANIRPTLENFLDILQDNRLVTFGGMVQYATDILTKSGPLPHLKRLFVDEYQDVNPAQVKLIHAMAPPTGQVIVVGDDLQCIYNWRGSDVARILNFPAEFHAQPSAVLTQNYRSRPGIVQVANAVASNIQNRFPKVMHAHRDNSAPAKAYYQSFSDEQEQANTIAQLVEKLHQEGAPYNSIAILIRSVTSAGSPIVDALKQRNIPVECPILTRGGTFIDTFVVPVFEWLKDERQNPINEEQEAEQIKAAEALWNTVKQWLPQTADIADRFWDSLNKWSTAITAKQSAAYDVRGRFYDLLNSCGVSLHENDHDLIVSVGIASQIIRAVEEIQRRRIGASPRKNARGIVKDVYYAIINNKDEFGESLPVNSDATAVIVTTVHQAKGLEWPIVILPTLNKNRFPLRNQPHGTSFPNTVASRYGTTEEDEWRLFYVACTRAKERLFLFDFAASNTKKQSVFTSRISNVLTATDFRNLGSVKPEVFQIAPDEYKTGDLPPVRVSLSDILVYAECPFQYGLRRIAGVRPSVPDALGYGQSIHELAQRRYDDGHNWSETELDQHVEAHVHIPLVSDGELAKSKAAIKDRVRTLEKVGAFTGDVKPELRVELVLEDGIIHGIADSVAEEGDGTVVKDWKTNVHPEFLDRYGDQLRFYVHALRTGNQKVTRAELIDIGATHKTEKLVAISVDVSEPTTQATIEKLTNALSGIKEGNFPPTPSLISCNLCDMNRICAYKVLV